MRIKFTSIKIPSSLIPHSKNEYDQVKEVSEYIYEIIQGSDTTDIIIDDKLLFIYSMFTSKLLENVVENSFFYVYGLKGHKYLSGDMTTVLSELITYSTLFSLYEVKLNNIIPFRTVKYLGTIADAVINLEEERKLAKELETENGLLFINIRASMTHRSYILVDKIWKTLLNIELVRYPDNYGLISIITREKESIKEAFVFITPE
ncbi:hypothetical protein [Stygiolobus caldivivus]|uniref:Uncharacterized protein n=1 Tax=Stygiolobus caldivivus TaxID=2824673 RepID=A0A8D5U7Q0_9CREN|nr:hypothetical protein [Stygiolobus caldivivus]BCU70507.1 hypothetical protein KN1_18040 [Stygiolobus caldivivus]